MGRIIQVGGYVTARPGAYQDSVQRFEGTSSGFLQSGVVALIAEGEATTQPKKVHSYKRGQDAKMKAEVSGDLLEAMRILFKPSKDDPNLVRGATEVKLIRPNVATQSTLDLEDGSSNDLVNLTSRIYGVKANGISAKIAAGTDGAYGKKLTVGRFGYVDEVKDNLGFNAALIVRYTGDASTATMQLSRTTLATTLAGDQTDLSVNLSIAFTTYDTLEKLSNYINAQTGYEAVVIRNDGSTFKCEDLDFLASGTDIKSPAVASGSISLASATATTFTGTSPTGLADGDLIKCESEYMYVTSASSKTVVRGYLNSVPVAHTSKAADIYTGISSVCKDVIDYCNNQSQHVTAARDTAYAVGTPSVPSSTTYFTSGSDGGTASSTDWDDAFNELRRHRVNFIVTLSNSSSIHSKLSDHLTWRWGIGSSEALGYAAADADEVFNALKARSKALNDANISLHFQDVEDWIDADGNTTTLDPWAMACAEAGMRAGMAFGEGCEDKILPFTTISHSLGSDLLDLDPDLTEAGLSYGDYSNRFNRFIRTVSTWTGNNNLEKIQHDVRNSLAWTLYKVRFRVQEKALARSQAQFGAQSLKSIIEDALDECRDVDKSIVEGSYRNEAGERVPIPAYEVYPVEVNGNVVSFAYKCVPAGANLFFVGDTFVADFQDAA